LPREKTTSRHGGVSYPNAKCPHGVTWFFHAEPFVGLLHPVHGLQTRATRGTAVQMRFDSIACYIVRPDESGRSHEILQLRRAKGEYLDGAWSTVRGLIEDGETAYTAAVREMREETSLVPLEFYQLDTVDVYYLAVDDTIWHTPAFGALVSRDAKVTLNEEHDAHRWVDRSRIDADFLWPGERAQLAELRSQILDDGPAKPYLRIRLDKMPPR
jgi:dATP pyrophosphohydrolase